MWNNVGAIVIILVILALGMFGFIAQRKNDEERITKWAANQGYKVESVEECLFSLGPFWYKNDDQHIYKAVLIDQFEHQRVSYFRTGLFMFDQAWDD